MARISARLIGDKELAAKLQRMADAAPKIGSDAMMESLLYLQSQTPGYPPAPPNSRYRRTGTLGRSVTSLASSNPDALTKVEPLRGNTITGTWGTRVKYAPDVIGRDTQRSIFAAIGWYTLEDVAERNIPGIETIWQKALRKLVNL